MKVGDLVRLNDENVFGIDYTKGGISVLGVVTKTNQRSKPPHTNRFRKQHIPSDSFQYINVHWFAREFTRVFHHDDYFDAKDFEVINECG